VITSLAGAIHAVVELSTMVPWFFYGSHGSGGPGFLPLDAAKAGAYRCSSSSALPGI
jgi:hypothetical protein